MTGFRGEKANPGEVGRVLDVKAVLMGRVAQRGGSLFISAELVDARDNSQIWGEQYNRRPDDIFAIQEEIGRVIAEKLRLRLTGEQKAGLAKQYTNNAEAYQDYLRGRFFWNKRTGDDLKTAIDYFQRAVAKDPTFALGYAGLAQSYVLLYNYGGAAASDAYPLAEQAALMQWLEKEFEQPGGDQMWFAANPIFDPLRSDPRFDDLLERMNLSGASYKEGWVP